VDFSIFKKEIQIQFAKMQKHNLLVTAAPKNEIWDTYLQSFPAGSDPIFVKKSEHDCNCCKQFIRTVGNVVSVVDGNLVSIWDAEVSDPNYRVVAGELSKFVKRFPIESPFFHYEQSIGQDKNYSLLPDKTKKTWSHFSLNIPISNVLTAAVIPATIGEYKNNNLVFTRALSELTLDSVDTVLELISQNSLYRGADYSFTLKQFRKFKIGFDNIKSDSAKIAFVWNTILDKNTSGSAIGIRNTAIGTLLVDLSAGVDLDVAVKSFESKVAPMNYKRPTALVTKSMIAEAKKKIESLGLTSALVRRHANLSDININNVLFVNKETKKLINGDVFSDISSSAQEKIKSFDKVTSMSIDKFISDILPNSTNIEILLENSHKSNFVSLVAPSDPTSRNLFKWNNNFSWSYAGEVADSIKERVKAAGGNVVGDLCIRLGWYNIDDLDLWVIEPNGHKVYFANRGQKSPLGGQLDVDMNAGFGSTTEPVENIVYLDANKLAKGTYTVIVNNFSQRNKSDSGYEVEVDFMGKTYSFSKKTSPANSTSEVVAKFSYSTKTGFNLIESNLANSVVNEKVFDVWGVKTNTFSRVSAIMTSPNCWDGVDIGNKHYFFMLDGCKSEGNVRGFYNEFLLQELTPHRKVIEIVGSKMLVEDSVEQLSGVGFSVSARNSLVCKVSGKFTRIIKIDF
jgi:hypothetical protein